MRKLLIAIVSTAFALSLAGCAGTSPKAEEENAEAQIDSADSTESTESQQSSAIQGDDFYYAGRYVVGEDIPAGGYVLITEEDYMYEDANESVVTVYPDTDHTDFSEAIVCEYFRGNYHISVSEGQLLEVARAIFVAA